MKSRFCGVVLAGLCMVVLSCPAKDRTTVKSIIDGMVKIPNRDFWLSETELTQGQWRAVMGDNPSGHKGVNMPVECVSKNDADAFIERLNKRIEVKTSRFVFALPTIDEWLCAAGAGGPPMEDRAWTQENCGGAPHEVATKLPNSFGIYDMQGNVWEWMGGSRDEKGRGIRRGGSFYDSAGGCSICRSIHTPSGRRYDCCGLRVAAHLANVSGEANAASPVPQANVTGKEEPLATPAGSGAVAAGAIEDAVAEPVNLTVPDKIAIGNASKVVDEICAEDFKALRKTQISPLALARKLLGYAKMTDDNAAKFVLYQEAFMQLVVGGELERAQELYDKVLKKCGARYASAMADKAGKAIEGKMKKGETAKSANKLYARTSSIKQCVEAIVAADRGLLLKPSDKTLKQQKANNCVKIGDWPRALSLYAEEPDGKRGEVARWELSDPEKRSKDFTAESVGDYWWKLIDETNERGLFYESVSHHAAYWYGKAIAEGGMSELRILLIKKRIASAIGEEQTSSDEAEVRATRPSKPAKQNDSAANAVIAGPVVLIPTAESGGTSCRYTVQKPRAIGWTSRWFDDSQWATCRTEINERVWNTSDIWVRACFNCEVDTKKIEKIVLRCRVDDDIEVWLNEKQVYRRNGVHSEYWDIPLEIKADLLKKKSVLCVHAYNRSGPQYVDFGLTAILSGKQ